MNGGGVSGNAASKKGRGGGVGGLQNQQLMSRALEGLSQGGGRVRGGGRRGRGRWGGGGRGRGKGYW